MFLSHYQACENLHLLSFQTPLFSTNKPRVVTALMQNLSFRSITILTFLWTFFIYFSFINSFSLSPHHSLILMSFYRHPSYITLFREADTSGLERIIIRNYQNLCNYKFCYHCVSTANNAFVKHNKIGQKNGDQSVLYASFF